MAKLLIKEHTQAEAVPFLRGILTRSLQDAGLDFNAAYKLASSIRQELSDDKNEAVIEITSTALRKKVLQRLSNARYGSDIIQRYCSCDIVPEPVWVKLNAQHSVPFSRAQHQQCLESCCFPAGKAETTTAQVYEYLLKHNIKNITSDKLKHITHDYLMQNLGEEAARRYLIWVNFSRSNRPLIVLIGGITGCGKSSIATELAHRLGIVRIQSTDMLREVMRMMTPKRLIPLLHTSSFQAGDTLPNNDNSAISNGYLAQAELLFLSCEAVIERALKERVSLILEGIHLHPALLRRLPKDNDAIFVPLMLGLLKPRQLRERFETRSNKAPERQSSRYLAHFDAIWQLQSFLLSEADRFQVPIIPNEDKNHAIGLIMKTIIEKLDASFTAKELSL